MNTTPTASPELPGLDNLETQARAADQDGQHIYTNPRDSDNWRANEIWHYLASPAAVLALIALARRAQPKGEAPQADLRRSVQAITRLLIDREWADVPLGDPDAVALFDAVDALVSANNEARAPAATLSPLCGAQHAESGKEAYQVFSHDGGEWYGVDKAQYDRAHDSCRRILAAQQTAAPGPAHETIIREGDNLVCTACGTSAPGTPEAPKGGVV